MYSKLLIDAIVRQTTVLIAQLSTAAGIRAPLSHVADQVFVALASEIERQGVGRKVVADMFGMALRTYQKRVQRLGESASTRGRTLWEAVHEFLAQHESVRRSEVAERFRNDSADDVAAVLSDLVSSGLVYATGRGASAVYKAVSAAEQRDSSADASSDALADMLWLTICRAGKLKLSELQLTTSAPPAEVHEALARLISQGIVHSSGPVLGDPELQAESFVIPVASARGWEASVFDHFSTVAAAIAAKVLRGPGSSSNEVVGGATFGFDVHDQHPYAERVLSLLSRTRADVDALWEEVAAYNRAHPFPEDRKHKVSFYFGQYVQDDDSAVAAHASQRPKEPTENRE